MQGDIERRLQQGIAAAKEGDRARARDNLIHVIELDERNVKAWLWLSSVVDSRADKIIALENVLEIAPANMQAERELQRARRQPPDRTPPSLPRLTRPQAAVDPVCLRCGYRNPSWVYLCDRCGADLRPVNVRAALGLISWRRSLAAMGIALCSVPILRAAIGAATWLLRGGSMQRLPTILFHCAAEALLPGLLLVLASIPITLLTWTGARLAGSQHELETHVQFTTVTISSWIILLAFLAPFVPAVPRLIGSQRTFDLIAQGTALLVSAILGGAGLIWLTQALQTVHHLSRSQATLITLTVFAGGAILLVGPQLAASGSPFNLVSILAVLFKSCSH
ncbi:MAG TPA: hypothetical protein ENN99_11085 [Chloroflexi bacterium]|nr:hypothetical protein [Chloroflexota bacterium]